MQYDQTTPVYVRYVVNRLQEMKKKQKQNEFQKLTQKTDPFTTSYI
jgi:histidyl-tRNA synthetase